MLQVDVQCQHHRRHVLTPCTRVLHHSDRMWLVFSLLAGCRVTARKAYIKMYRLSSDDLRRTGDMERRRLPEASMNRGPGIDSELWNRGRQSAFSHVFADLIYEIISEPMLAIHLPERVSHLQCPTFSQSARAHLFFPTDLLPPCPTPQPCLRFSAYRPLHSEHQRRHRLSSSARARRKTTQSRLPLSNHGLCHSPRLCGLYFLMSQHFHLRPTT